MSQHVRPPRETGDPANTSAGRAPVGGSFLNWDTDPNQHFSPNEPSNPVTNATFVGAATTLWAALQAADPTLAARWPAFNPATTPVPEKNRFLIATNAAGTVVKAFLEPNAPKP